MINQAKHYLSLICVIVFAFTISGCSGLPDHLVKQAEAFSQKLITQKSLNDKAISSFENYKKNKEWGFIAPYFETEVWNDHFKQSDTELELASAMYSTKIVPLMDKDDPEDSKVFEKLLIKFGVHLSNSSLASRAPSKRVDFLIHTRDHADTIFNQAKVSIGEIESLNETFTTKGKQAIKNYPRKSSDINGRITESTSQSKSAIAMFETLTKQYDFYKSGMDTNFALFGDKAVEIEKKLNNVKQYVQTNSNKLNELYKSYTKVLADQRIEYYVTIRRASWCEGEYCGSGSEINFPPRQVDEKVFEYFDSLNQDLVAKLSGGWGRPKFNVKIPKNYWDALKISYNQNMPRGDDYAEYWVAKTQAKTFHKYVEIINDTINEGEWVSVSEDSFWKQNDNLGMAILTKPYGYYEEDSQKAAQPVGLAMVSTPVIVDGQATGSNQYGEWQQRNGTSFWYYYGMYSFMNRFIGSSSYSYNSWKSYNRRDRSRGFYGNNSQWGTWGANTYNSDRFRNSDYAKSNPNTVREARTSATSTSKKSSRLGSADIRAAGSASRSRGPSGGGK